ncbi:ethanolamine utilization protein EutN/carboxysome structural protein Ccml [Thermincola ferriacetica]|uniref:Ethanolamine utilization protein EutN/carboxysome structural protein Ccml n=3 Tax=Thermincola TaxID=278993 RepID=D5XBV3_THEPJ|nr:EutN/CcmL family microcompartment protein [Thermincola ferriacetica]ADG81501.1 Ethanolamine utilization protein EutN/carboxysome structural protein Ccml [Thermincola potens JR]KNZ68962.1 ethanolamine utilization protein EutN/carboxysome structural protein Ccml [Thermincola ferriacetica]
MYLAKVVGTVVSTSKDPRLTGCKLLLVVPVALYPQKVEYPLVAVDSVGAGIGEMVLCVDGSTARRAVTEENAPIDCAIVGIIDEVETCGDLLQPEKLSLLDGEKQL